jgi:general secretion pathway protein C
MHVRTAIEVIFRKHFWVVHLVFLFLVTWLLARTVNVFVESAIAPASTVQPTKAASRPKAAEPVAQLNAEKLAKLTGLPPPVKDVPVVEPEKEDMSSAPVRTSLAVKLLGTLLAASPEWSIASIYDDVTKKTQTYMVGSLIQGAEVLEIERERVIIKHNGRREFIDSTLGGGGGAIAYAPTPAMASPVNTSPPPSSALGTGIKSTGNNNYEIPRAEIDKTLSNLNDVAMQARIVPAFKDGVAQGFKLFSIRPDSIYTKIGIQNGDVIKRINGFDLNSPEKALEIYSKLKEANRIDIEVERNGAVVKKTYSVTP